MQGTYDGVATFIASGAITRNARVKVTSPTTTSPAQCEIAGANDPAIGVAEYAVADGDEVAVRLYGAGTMQMIADDAIVAGAEVYGAADGEITDLAGASKTTIGAALEAAAAAGDIIHVAPYGREIPG